MPHVSIKMFSGRSLAEKQKIAEAVANALQTVGGIPRHSISVAVEDVNPPDWDDRVYQAEILTAGPKLLVKPDY